MCARSSRSCALTSVWQPGRERPPGTDAGPGIGIEVGVAHVPALAPGRDCRAAQRAARSRTPPSGIGCTSFTCDPLLRDSCLLGQPPVARSRPRGCPCGRKTTLSGHFTPLFHEEFRHAVPARLRPPFGGLRPGNPRSSHAKSVEPKRKARRRTFITESSGAAVQPDRVFGEFPRASPVLKSLRRSRRKSSWLAADAALGSRIGDAGFDVMVVPAVDLRLVRPLAVEKACRSLARLCEIGAAGAESLRDRVRNSAAVARTSCRANPDSSWNRRAPGALGVDRRYLSQFSTLRADTRLNSATLSVTQTAPSARACAAISMSCAPIGVPFFSSATRIAA